MTSDDVYFTESADVLLSHACVRNSLHFCTLYYNSYLTKHIRLVF